MYDLIDERIEKVEKACEKYHFSCHASINGIFIRTGSLAGWFILLEESGARLFHENYRHCERYGNGIMEKYHEHTNVEKKDDLELEMVEYIRAHDLIMKNPRASRARREKTGRKRKT